MRHYLLALLILAGSSSLSLGADEKDKKKKADENPQVERMVTMLLERFDANKDGKISKDEAKGKLAVNFDKLDTNKDGYLDKEELRKAAQFMIAKAKEDAKTAKPNANGNKPPNAKPGNQQAGRDFDSMDKDADGRLTREELKNTAYSDKFDEIDTNKDGKIDRKEFQAYLRKLAEKTETKDTKEVKDTKKK
jgi:Ca2+-binding EF-hand superfamily protein